MWAVQAIRDGKQVPTFYLNKDVQGIVSKEQAEQVAREVLGLVDSDWSTDSITVEYVGY